MQSTSGERARHCQKMMRMMRIENRRSVELKKLNKRKMVKTRRTKVEEVQMQTMMEECHSPNESSAASTKYS